MTFLADTDPDFVLLRPELRSLIREAEKLAREGIKGWLGSLPEQAQILFGPVFEELPQQFLRGQLPFYQMLDTLWPLAEQAQREKLIRSSAVM